MNKITFTQSSNRFSAASRMKKVNGTIMPYVVPQRPMPSSPQLMNEYGEYAMNEVLPRYLPVSIRGIATITIPSAIEPLNSLPEQYYLREVPTAADSQGNALAQLASNRKRGRQ
jgi:hypothetical protein